MQRSPYIKLIAGILSLALIIGASYGLYKALINAEKDIAHNNAVDQPVVRRPAGPISVQGRLTCLPHRAQGEFQTLECAIGFADEKGTYYSLRDTSPDYSIVSSASHDAVVIVSGTFRPSEDQKYMSTGIIDVESIVAADAPQRATLEGTIVCLPHKDTTGPQTEECAFGLKTDEGTYYAIDFYLMSQMMEQPAAGSRFSGSGVVTPLKLLSTNMWDKYPIEGIFSVTNIPQ